MTRKDADEKQMARKKLTNQNFSKGKGDLVWDDGYFD
ncbi:hypothetical protein TNIN_419751, partial [Trichonephila inaurata madagascariensis]